MPKLTLSPEIERQVNEILAPLQHPEEWIALELPFAPSPSAIVLMEGASGTGKTTLAMHMARKLKQEPILVSFAKVAGAQNGETEKAIVSTFQKAHDEKKTTIFMDEVDSLLWDRSLINGDNIHFLGFINTLLVEIDRFVNRSIPSLLLLSTNYPHLLDSALLRRITDKIKLTLPTGSFAVKMWKSKLPKSIRDTLKDDDHLHLSNLNLTPDEIEKKILRGARRAMFEHRQPTLTDMLS